MPNISPNNLPNSFPNNLPSNLINLDSFTKHDPAAAELGTMSGPSNNGAPPKPTVLLRLRGRDCEPDELRHSMRMTASTRDDSRPGDWNNGPNLRYRGPFRRFARGGELGTAAEESLFGVIICRDQLATYVDHVVESYKFPKSQGRTTLEWERHGAIVVDSGSIVCGGAPQEWTGMRETTPESDTKKIATVLVNLTIIQLKPKCQNTNGQGTCQIE